MACCSNCGKELTAENTTRQSKKDFCIECYNTLYKKCNSCGKIHLKKNMKLTGKGFFCQACVKIKFHTCDICGKEHLTADCVEVVNKDKKSIKICKSCFTNAFLKCEECGEIFEKEGNVFHTVVIGATSKLVCDNCFNNNFLKCTFCGKWHKKSELSSFDKFKTAFCDSCGSERYKKCSECGEFIQPEEEDAISDGICFGCYIKFKTIHEYNYKPAPIFKLGKGEPSANNNRFYGTEIEFECFQDGNKKNYMVKDRFSVEHKLYIASLINDELGKIFYQKRDGTIRYGIEMVSHPLSFNAWKELNELIYEKFNMLTTNHCRADSEDNCGMHVHISKAGISNAGKSRLALFINNNKDQVERIAERANNGFCKFIKVQKDKTDTSYLLNTQKYQALNWSPPSTAEIRVFRSTLDPDKFYKNIEFCDSAVSFSEITSASVILDSEECWKQYTDFISNNLDKYSHINNFLQNNS